MIDPLPDFSPELRLLLSFLRLATHGSGTVDRPGGNFRWPLFLGLVERHRVGPVLWHLAAAPVAAACPPAAVARLQAAATAAAQRALFVLTHQIRLGRLLADAGIESLPVKGLVLAEQLYGGIGRRHIGDLDLLVRPADAPRADALLQAAGLVRTRPDFSLTPRQARAYLRLKPEFEYRLPAAALRVELLWRLEGLPAGDDPFAGAVACAPGGQPARTIAPDTNALYLFEHGARHAWFRLFWLVDVALLLREPGRDWAALAARARRLGLERSVLQGAALARDLLGVALPPALLPRAGERRRVASLAREARRQLRRPPAVNERPLEWFRQAAYRVRLKKKLRAKFTTMTPHLFSPLNWQTLPLPDRWFFLYYFATPFLWLWRRARRAA